MAYTTIDKPADYFNTKLYTGNGSTQSITGVGFQPDWTWLKQRNDPTAYSHQLFDVIRGATNYLVSNTGDAAVTNANTLTSFNSDGFSLGSNVGINNSGISYVGWNWLANGAGVSNTQGSITSTVSANTTAGFSVVGYTGNGANGATFGHGLGVTPKFVIIKNREVTEDWQVWFNNTTRVRLNSTAASLSTFPISTSSTLITLPNFDGAWNSSGVTYISYSFADVKGYSKFGSYTGNGSADGTFVYTGFKPAFVMFKRTDSTSNWTMLDTKRSPFNLMKKELYANLSNSEAENGRDIDFLSNGIKIRSSSTEINGSSASYIYMAFAENPFVTSKGIPTTAR